VYEPSLGTRNLGDDVKPRHVGCIYNDIRAHIIAITFIHVGTWRSYRGILRAKQGCGMG
jgi:hypothetical protein